ncbi:flippase [Dehalobacter sp. DCM]|uniref:flippase n=1 Tax=Dehalobacter sp. DCM TaxID=2907827 RepID=UPI00308170D8|nr:flippase [Dehalobacter sp. DCM]
MDNRLIIKNATALGVSGFMAKAITAVVGIFITRYLGPGPYGDYSAAYAFAGAFILFAEWGISQLMVQEGSRNPLVLPRYFGNTLLFKSLLAILCYFLMLVFMFPAGYNQTIKTLILVIGLAVCFNALNQSVYNYYQAVQKNYLSAWFQFLTTMLIAVFSVIVILRGMGIVAFTFGYLFSYIIISILLFLALRKEIRPVVQLNSLPDMVKRGMPFGIHRIFYYLFAQISIIILSLITTSVELGIFSAAYKLMLVLIFIPSLMTSALYPVLYQLGETDADKHQNLTEKIFKVLSAVGIAGSTLIFVLAEPLVAWLYDGKFNGSAPILMIVTWLLAFECMSFSLGDVLTTTNRQWQRTILQGSALVILIAMILILYPRLGVYGAAYTVIAVEAFIFAGYYLLVRRGVYKLRLWRQLYRTFIAALLMAGTAWMMKDLHPLISAATAGIVFCTVLLILDKEFRKIGQYVWGMMRRLLRQIAHKKT